MCAPGALAADAWTPWTGPADATVRSLDFTAAGTLVASTDGEGLFQSAFAVGPWAATNDGLTTTGDLEAYQVVAFGANLYAATGGGLFTAPAGGGSWTQLGAGTGPAKLGGAAINAVAVESADSIIVAPVGAPAGGIYTSADGGSTWMRAAGMPDGENVYSIAKGPGSIVYAAGDSGVWTSADAGSSWTLTSDGIDTSTQTAAGQMFVVAVGPPPDYEVWAGTGDDIFKSSNGGRSWTEAEGSGETALPAGGQKSAFLLAPTLTATKGDVLVGTYDGVYASDDDGADWGQMSTAITAPSNPTLFGTRIIKSLGVGFSTPALLAGTEGFGAYSLPLTPLTAPSVPTVAPSSGLVPGDTMTATPHWSGTLPIFPVFTWKRCSGSNCTAVPNGNGPTYIIPDGDGNTSYTYEAEVCGTNLLVSTPVCSTSAKTSGGVGTEPGNRPETLGSGPLSSIGPNTDSAPYGGTFTIDPGKWELHSNPGVQYTPPKFIYQWDRCASGTCTVIVGATGASYTTTATDVGYDVNGYVAAGPNGSIPGSDLYLAGEIGTVQEKTPVNIEAPKIVGPAYVGTTLQSSAGAWTADDPTYTRRWLECDSDGEDCTPFSPEQTGSTYTIQPSDLGDTLELEVTATQPDPSQDRVAVVDSAVTAVITNPPSPGGGASDGGGSGGNTGGGGAAATAPPSLSRLTLGHSRKTGTINFTLGGAGSAILQLQRVTTGHTAHHRCVAGKRKHARKCTIDKTVYTKTVTVTKAGKVSIALPTKVRGSRLPHGGYRVLVTPVSTSGKHGSPRSLALRLG